MLSSNKDLTPVASCTSTHPQKSTEKAKAIQKEGHTDTHGRDVDGHSEAENNTPPLKRHKPDMTLYPTSACPHIEPKRPAALHPPAKHPPVASISTAIALAHTPSTVLTVINLDNSEMSSNKSESESNSSNLRQPGSQACCNCQTDIEHT